LSGRITPARSEMVNGAEKLNEAGITTPLIVGGATTSKLHTAIKIAPRTSAPVIHALDASQNPIIAAKLLNNASRQQYIDEITAEYEEIRSYHCEGETKLLPLTEARKHKLMIDWAKRPTPTPLHTGVNQLGTLPLDKVTELINWRMYFNFWKLSGDFVDDFPYDLCEHCTAQWLARHASNPKAAEALKVYRDAITILGECNATVRGVVGIFPAWSEDDDTIIVGGQAFPMLRRQEPNADGVCLSLADFVMPHNLGEDYVGAFVVSADASDKLVEIENDKYSSMVLRALLDRLAEAGAEYLHRYVRCQYWGYNPDVTATTADLLAGNYQGIRPAMGYPMTPDQLLNHQIAKLLSFDSIGVTLTENGAMTPPSTVSGLYIAHPDARYFMVGKIGDDQLSDYSRRRAIAKDRMRNILNKNL
ncbi:MAG: methionine synthase, partial [Muribaculaceae bacterium]|nr:methionine synthase [Muribaculaceae bacterium]